MRSLSLAPLERFEPTLLGNTSRSLTRFAL